MRKKLFALFLVLLAMGTVGAQDFPSQGRLLHFNFNGNARDAKKNSHFIFIEDSVYVEGSQGQPATAIRMHGSRVSYDFDFFAKKQATVVMKVRVDSVNGRSDVFLAFGPSTTDPRSFSLNSDFELFAEVYRTRHNKGDTKDLFKLPAIEPGKWTTLVAMWDQPAQMLTLGSEGKFITLKSPRMEETSTGSYDRTFELFYNGYVALDELAIYDRLLTADELGALNGGRWEQVEPEQQQPDMGLKPTLIAVQLIVAALCFFYLRTRRKKLPLRSQQWSGAAGGKTREECQSLLDKAFEPWTSKIEVLAEGEEPHYYYPDKAQLKQSVSYYRQALACTCDDADVKERFNLFARLYEAAQRRTANYNVVFILAAVVCVYVSGMIGASSLPIGHPIDYLGLPDSFWGRMWYFTIYGMPSVLIATVAYLGCSHSPNYVVKAGERIHLDAPKSVVRAARVAQLAGIPVLGALASLGAIGVGIASALWAIGQGLSALRFNRIIHLRNGQKVGESTELDGGSIGTLAAGIIGILVALFVIYLLSHIVLFLYGWLFAYAAVRNYLIKK